MLFGDGGIIDRVTGIIGCIFDRGDSPSPSPPPSTCDVPPGKEKVDKCSDVGRSADECADYYVEIKKCTTPTCPTRKRAAAFRESASLAPAAPPTWPSSISVRGPRGRPAAAPARRATRGLPAPPLSVPAARPLLSPRDRLSPRGSAPCSSLTLSLCALWSLHAPQPPGPGAQCRHTLLQYAAYHV